LDPLAFFRLLRRHWLILLIIIVAGTVSTFYFTTVQPSIYEAATTLIVRPSPKLEREDHIINSLNTLDRRTIVATVAKIPSSAKVRSHAWGNLSAPGQDIAQYKVTTIVLPDTNILQVSVEGPDPAVAASFANAIADVTASSLSEYYDMYQLTLLDPATAPSYRIRPSLKRNMSVGILMSLLLGILLALVLEYVKHMKKDSLVDNADTPLERGTPLSKEVR